MVRFPNGLFSGPDGKSYALVIVQNVLTAWSRELYREMQNWYLRRPAGVRESLQSEMPFREPSSDPAAAPVLPPYEGLMRAIADAERMDEIPASEQYLEEGMELQDEAKFLNFLQGLIDERNYLLLGSVLRQRAAEQRRAMNDVTILMAHVGAPVSSQRSTLRSAEVEVCETLANIFES
ncbi:MAG TPA: hypothetical protein VD967_00910 [Candidatus Paceibacterota bacterium]|nr:hypothetical protein [Candidatus Paceibacterota bacterium]